MVFTRHIRPVITWRKSSIPYIHRTKIPFRMLVKLSYAYNGPTSTWGSVKNINSSISPSIYPWGCKEGHQTGARIFPPNEPCHLLQICKCEAVLKITPQITPPFLLKQCAKLQSVNLFNIPVSHSGGLVSVRRRASSRKWLRLYH